MKEKLKSIIILMVLLLLYIVVIKIARPYIYSNFDNSLIFTFFGVLPNFIGSIILFIFGQEFLNFLKIKNIIFGIVLVFFMELNRLYFSQIPFDIFDILASAIALSLCYILTKENENN